MCNKVNTNLIAQLFCDDFKKEEEEEKLFLIRIALPKKIPNRKKSNISSPLNKNNVFSNTDEPPEWVQ